VNTRVRHASPWLSWGLLSAAGLAVGAAALVWTRTEILSLRYEQSHLLSREAGLRADVEKLRVEEAALSAPERIERRARKLGLRYPVAGQVLREGDAP
jgi:cell division protein FtsL